MSVPHIDVSDSGFWPTATAQVRECNPEQWEKRREDQGGTLRSTYLQDAVKYQTAERSWPTITAQDAKNDAGPSQWERRSDPLNVAVKRWPTPKGSPSGPDFARMNRPESGGDDLVMAVARGGSTARRGQGVEGNDRGASSGLCPVRVFAARTTAPASSDPG